MEQASTVAAPPSQGVAPDGQSIAPNGQPEGRLTAHALLAAHPSRPLLVRPVRHAGDEPRAATPHRHPEGLLYALDKGLISVQRGNSFLLMPRGRLGWIPPRALHASAPHEPVEGWVAFVEPAAAAGLPEAACTLPRAPLLEALVQRAAGWDLSQPWAAAQQRLFEVLLDEMRGAVTDPAALPMPADRRLLTVAHGLLRNPADESEAEVWAERGGLSPRTLRRRFREETGLSFNEWRAWARLHQAMQWLADGQPVQAVALSLGYGTASAFIAAFKRRIGCTPAAWAGQATDRP